MVSQRSPDARGSKRDEPVVLDTLVHAAVSRPHDCPVGPGARADRARRPQPVAAEAGGGQRPRRRAASARPVRTDPCAGRRGLHRAAGRDRRGRPAAAARLAGRVDGGHAGAGRHRAADGLLAAREAARAPAGARPASPHRDAHRRFGVPPRGRRVLRARPRDERRAAAARRRADARRDVRRPAEAERVAGAAVADGRAVSLRQPSATIRAG